jgi:surfactin synthase thioesterase subunit
VKAPGGPEESEEQWAAKSLTFSCSLVSGPSAVNCGSCYELRPSARIARYPGRFGGETETAAGSFGELVESCAAQVRSREAARPILVGHGFGAYAAYATAKKLEELGTEVSALVVAGAAAPGLLSVPGSATQDRSATAAFLDGIADEPPSGWSETVLDAVAQDLRLLEEFSASAHGEVRCPVLAARGEADPVTSTSGICQWADVTASWCDHKVFPGGHSDLLRSPEFASWVSAAQARDARLKPDPSSGS